MIEESNSKAASIVEKIRYKLQQISGRDNAIIYIEGDERNELEGIIKYSLGRKHND